MLQVESSQIPARIDRWETQMMQETRRSQAFLRVRLLLLLLRRRRTQLIQVLFHILTSLLVFVRDLDVLPCERRQYSSRLVCSTVLMHRFCHVLWVSGNVGTWERGVDGEVSFGFGLYIYTSGNPYHWPRESCKILISDCLVKDFPLLKKY